MVLYFLFSCFSLPLGCKITEASDHILFLFVFLESLELSTIPVNSRCLKYLCAIWMVVLVLFSKTDMVNEVISPTSGSSYLGRKAEGGQGNCDALWYLLMWSLNEGGVASMYLTASQGQAGEWWVGSFQLRERIQPHEQQLEVFNGCLPQSPGSHSSLCIGPHLPFFFCNPYLLSGYVQLL